jgi:hypothetical protein
MKTFLIAFFLGLIFLTPYPIEKKQTITSSRFRSYKLVQKNNSSQNYLLSFCGNNDEITLKIHNNRGEVVFEKGTFKGTGYGRKAFIHEGYLYFISDNIFTLNLNDFSIRKTTIFNSDYRTLEIVKYQNKDFLIAASKKDIDIYDLSNFKLYRKINREEDVRINIAKYSNGKIIYTKKENIIAIYDLINNNEIWSYDFGTQDFYFLGIKVGSGNDFITDFNINENRLFLFTVMGSIFKFNLETGKVLLKKEKFKGDDNNAGLIPNFDLVDMNNDGVKDIVGGSVDYNVYCINGKDLSIIWEFDTDNEIQLPLSFYDINGDKIPEVFTVNDYDNNLFILDGKTGKLLVKKGIKDKDYKKLIQTSVTMADFDGNGLLDLIVDINPSTIQVYEMSDVRVPANSIIYSPWY